MIWTFDRADRLAALLLRAREGAEYLRRDMLDTPRGTAARDSAAARLAAADSRIRRLCAAARSARRGRAAMAEGGAL